MIRVKKIGKDGLEHEYLQFYEDEIARIKKHEEDKKKKAEQEAK